jgi:hypothetical protein
MTGAFLKPLRAPEPQFVAQAAVFLTLVPRSARINFPEQAELSAFTLILNTKPPSSTDKTSDRTPGNPAPDRTPGATGTGAAGTDAGQTPAGTSDRTPNK